MSDETYRLALRQLEHREYSSGTMRQYLRRRRIEASVIDETVQRLVIEHWIDDDRYARMLVRAELNRGKGAVFIRQKLAQKGVRLDLHRIQEWLAEFSPVSETERAREIVERRYPDAWSGDRKAANRAFQALIRRGFSIDAARSVLKDKLKEERHEHSE